MRLKLIFLVASITVAINPIVIKDKNDSRYIAYNDSLALYNAGQWQIAIAKAMKNREDIVEGRSAMDTINQLMSTLNQNIKPIAHRPDIGFLYKQSRSIKMYWDPDIYAKPTSAFIFRKKLPIISLKIKKVYKIQLTDTTDLVFEKMPIMEMPIKKEYFTRIRQKQEIGCNKLCDVFRKDGSFAFIFHCHHF